MCIKLNDINHSVANPVAIVTLTASVASRTILVINGFELYYANKAARNRDFVTLSDKMAGG